MPKYKPLNYKEVSKVLKNLGFQQSQHGSTSHQIWKMKQNEKVFSVTIAFHRMNIEFKKKTLNSMIRQSGYTKEEFYKRLKKK